MSMHQLHVATVSLPQGSFSGKEWEEKKAALAAFAQELFAKAPGQPETEGSHPTSIQLIARIQTDFEDSSSVWNSRTEPLAPGTTNIVGTPEELVYPTELNVRLDKSPIHGKGMFALKDFEDQEVVEVCPTLEVDHNDIGGILEDYVYYGDNPDNRVIVMGYGMMYNSWKNSNLWYYRDKDGNFVYVTSRKVKKGDELCIDYGPEWWGSRDQKDKLDPMNEDS